MKSYLIELKPFLIQTQEQLNAHPLPKPYHQIPIQTIVKAESKKQLIQICKSIFASYQVEVIKRVPTC